MPETNERTPSPCANFEEWILDDLDGAFDSTQRQQIEAHLTGCSSCRDFREHQEALDTVLSSNLRRAALPATFKQTMLQQAQAALRAGTVQSPALSAVEASDVKDFEGYLQRQFWRGVAIRVLDWSGIGAGAVVLAVALNDLAPQIMDSLANVRPESFNWIAVSALTAAALGAGLWIAFRGRMRAAWDWF